MSKGMNKKRTPSRAGKIRGIYKRGNIFWFCHMERGRRTQVSLATSDYSEAVANAVKVLHDPFLNDSAPLHDEIVAFLDHKTRQNEYSFASRESKQYALKEFA